MRIHSAAAGWCARKSQTTSTEPSCNACRARAPAEKSRSTTSSPSALKTPSCSASSTRQWYISPCPPPQRQAITEPPRHRPPAGREHARCTGGRHDPRAANQSTRHGGKDVKGNELLHRNNCASKPANRSIREHPEDFYVPPCAFFFSQWGQPPMACKTQNHRNSAIAHEQDRDIHHERPGPNRCGLWACWRHTS